MNKFLFAEILTLALLGGFSLQGQDSNWKRTDSDSPYHHQIQLRDSAGRAIVPGVTDPEMPDLSRTCAPCHDVEAASGGLHGGEGNDGRRGEPWFLVDSRSASTLPFHKRSWPGLSSPADLDIDSENWSKTFGRHSTGGNSDPSKTTSDCLVCHLAQGYDFAKRIERFDAGDSSLATFIAAGLINDEGEYDLPRFDNDNKVYLDLLADAGPNSCLPCHTVKDLDSGSDAQWLHEKDIHLSAGMTCVDCHRSGIQHHMVRGFEGESHPSGADVSSLSCRGCHIGSEGGHSGAPNPRHAGLPPFHLEEIHCTGCHSGPAPESTGTSQWTSRAHRLGEPSQSRTENLAPHILFAGIDRDESNVLGPVRRTWPTGWGFLDEDGDLKLIPPGQLRRPLRKALRVRANLVEEMSDKIEDNDATELIESALKEIDESILRGDGKPVLLTGGRVLSLDDSGKMTTLDSDAGNAVSWPIGHPVRSARTAVGAGGCTDCHSSSSSWLAIGTGPQPVLPLPENPSPRSSLENGVIDEGRWNSWSLLFQGREIGKVFFSLCSFLAISGSLLALWRSMAQESR